MHIINYYFINNISCLLHVSMHNLIVYILINSNKLQRFRGNLRCDYSDYTNITN